MKRILIILLLIDPVMLFAQKNRFVIDGKIIADTLTKGKVYMYYEDNGKDLRDSSAVVNNTYHFQGTMKDGGIRVSLFLKDSLMSKHAKGFAQFYVQPGRAYVTHNSDFSRKGIKGSLLQVQADSVAAAGERYRQEHGGSSDPNIEIDFIKHHPDSWLSFVYLKNHVIRMHDISNDEADALYASLGPRLKNYNTVQLLKGLIDGRRKAVVGNPAIDFTEKDIAGNTVALSSYRGKYVLIDFWASWCHPCRAENPYVTAAYHKFKSKGLNILSVSLDVDRRSWLKAVKQDHLEWTQVSNLKGFDDAVAVKYGIHAIPANFLISPDGIIIAKDLRGEKLDEALTRILDNKNN